MGLYFRLVPSLHRALRERHAVDYSATDEAPRSRHHCPLVQTLKAIVVTTSTNSPFSRVG
jgi:hypothetical protein